jgi:hypothetical protein
MTEDRHSEMPTLKPTPSADWLELQWCASLYRSLGIDAVRATVLFLDIAIGPIEDGRGRSGMWSNLMALL